mgnify:CR=1 FL=1
MANGVLTSSLEWTPCILFFGVQALPKNRGACVDTWFWQDTERKGFQYEKVSRRRVGQLLYLGYRHSTSSPWPKLYSEWQNLVFWVLFGRLHSQYDLRWRSALKRLSSSRRDDRFSYINHLNPSSYATCGDKTRSEIEAAESFRTNRVDWLGETELIRKITESYRKFATLTRWDRKKLIGETEIDPEIAKDSCPS